MAELGRVSEACGGSPVQFSPAVQSDPAMTGFGVGFKTASPGSIAQGYVQRALMAFSENAVSYFR